MKDYFPQIIKKSKTNTRHWNSFNMTYSKPAKLQKKQSNGVDFCAYSIAYCMLSFYSFFTSYQRPYSVVLRSGFVSQGHGLCYLCLLYLRMVFFFKQKTAYEMLRSLVGSENVYKRQVLSVNVLILFLCKKTAFR